MAGLEEAGHGRKRLSEEIPSELELCQTLNHFSASQIHSTCDRE